MAASATETAVRPGVLVISHGSRDASWVSIVDEAVAGVLKERELPAAVSFLELVEGRSIQDGIYELENRGVTDILVIPLFVSSGSTHVDEIAYALGAKPEPGCETDLEPFAVSARVHYGDPVDDDPIIAGMVWDKVRELSEEPERETVLLVGHGSVHDGFRENWQRGMSSLAARVGAIGGVGAADYGLLNPGDVRDKVAYWNERGHRVLVAPIFLSEGYFTKTVIPARLEGLDYRYSGRPLLPHPRMADWLNAQIGKLLARI